MAFGFVEDIHVSSNTCKDVQACANTGSVSDEKSKNVQIHASLSKDFAGSLLDGMAADGEDGRSVRPLLSVRQVAKLLGVCPATVYALCDQGKLPHFRVLNAIRVDIQDVKAILRQLGRRSERQRLGAATLAKSPGGWSDAVYSMPGPDRVSRDQSFVDLSGSCMHDRPGGFTGTWPIRRRPFRARTFEGALRGTDPFLG